MKSTMASCEEFVTLLASDAPAPGGGGAAALVGALGTALGNMVGSLTVGKAKYAEVEGEILELKQTADEIQESLIALVTKDAEVFLPLSKAYGLPKASEEEQAHKAQVMEACLLECAQVPLEIMHFCGSALKMLERMEQIGSTIAISDVGCGALSLKAALLSADLNVRVNTMLMKERNTAEQLNSDADELLATYAPLADEVYRKVLERLY